MAESHDQGWADNPDAGNWSWLELIILGNENSGAPRSNNGVDLVWRSHRNPNRTEQFGWVRYPKTKLR